MSAALFKKITLAFCLALFAFILSGVEGEGFAQEKTTLRASSHERFGRMVFGWSGAVRQDVKIVDNELVVQFSREVEGDVEREIVRVLSGWVGGVRISPDRKTLIFPLKRKVEASPFINGVGEVVIDLILDPKAAAEPPPPPEAAPAPAPPTPTPPAAPSPPERASSPLANAETVNIRAADHGAFYRIVFSWPKAVTYQVTQQGEQAAIIFSLPGKADENALKTRLPPDIKLVSVDIGGDGRTAFVFSLPPQARIRHFSSREKGDVRFNYKVVADIVRNAGPTPPEEAKPAEEKKEEPAPPPPAGQPPQPPAVPSPAEEAKAPASAPPTPPPAAFLPPAVAGDTSRVPYSNGKEAARYSLAFPQSADANAALFERDGYLWLVLDRYRGVNVDDLKKAGGEALLFAEQRESREATVLRLIARPGYYPSVRKDSAGWAVDFDQKPSLPSDPIRVEQPVTLGNGIGIAFNVANAPPSIKISDPEVGDVMMVTPVGKPGAGVYPGRDVPDVLILPTFQGIALVPRIDGLDVRNSRSNVTVGAVAAGGLKLTPVEQAAALREKNDTPLDMQNWAGGGAQGFAKERDAITGRLADAPPALRGQAYLGAAQFFLANGFAAEALGYANLAAFETPTIIDTGVFRAVRGAANATMGRWDAAIFDLDNPIIKDDREVAFWSAIAHAGRNPENAENAKRLANVFSFLSKYPPQLQWPLALIVAREEAAAGNVVAAEQATILLDHLASTPARKAWVSYYWGRLAELKGDVNNALNLYEAAQNSENYEARAKAGVAHVELALRTNRIDAADAARQLDKLRFVWRQEDFEFGYLKRFSDLLIEAGDYPEALRTLRTLSNYYPENPGTPALQDKMREVFSRLYLGGLSDVMPPITALGLYDEFRDLSPSGKDGDEIIRKLADRLVSVDLLDRGAALLSYQMENRLSGVDKARVGEQVALLNILDKKPGDALVTLDRSEVSPLPPELDASRRKLRAQALADLGRVDEAIALLSNDFSTDAARLRAEIYWTHKNWKAAARTFASLVTRPAPGEKLDNASAGLVMSWATALILDGDEPGLAALGRNFTGAMSGGPYEEGFRFLTSALDYGLPDMPTLERNIQQAEGFKTFLSSYRDLLRSRGVSAIN